VERVLCVANQKGGVGKPTTAINLACCLAKADRRTLLVDLDPQCNATTGLGAEPSDDHPLVTCRPIREGVCPTATPALDLLPGSRHFRQAELLRRDDDGQADRLREHLIHGFAAYDFVLIDCPPSLGRLTLNAFVAADGVLVPLQCEYYAMEGLSQLLETIAAIREGLNPRLRPMGIVLTMFDARTNLSRQVADEVKKYFPDLVFEAVIPRSVRLAEAPSHGIPVFLHDIRSSGAGAYLDLSRELLQRWPAAETAPAEGASGHDG